MLLLRADCGTASSLVVSLPAPVLRVAPGDTLDGGLCSFVAEAAFRGCPDRLLCCGDEKAVVDFDRGVHVCLLAVLSVPALLVLAECPVVLLRPFPLGAMPL